MKTVLHHMYDIGKLKELRNHCAEGLCAQNEVREEIGDDFFLENIYTGSDFLVIGFQLLSNMCVENHENQLHFFDLILPLLSRVHWTIPSAVVAEQFIVTCTTPTAACKDKLSMTVLEPFFDVAGNEEVDFLLATMFARIACDVVEYSFAHPSIALRLLDLLQDGVELCREDVDCEAFIRLLLNCFKQDVLPIEMGKSKLMGILFVLISKSLRALEECRRQNAMEVLLEMKKIDKNDQILLEWTVATMQVLVRGIE